MQPICRGSQPPLRQHRILPWRRRAAPGAHRKPHRQQGRQQQHPQAVFDQHIDGNLRAGLFEQAGFLRFDLLLRGEGPG
jgi:hypothetical protein